MKLNTTFLKSALDKAIKATLYKLTQKSSVAGIVTFVATAVGAVVEPALAGTIATVGATVASGLLILFNEKETTPAVKAPAKAEVAAPAEGETH